MSPIVVKLDAHFRINPIFFRTINIALLVLKISVSLKQPRAAVNLLKKVRLTINQKKMLNISAKAKHFQELI